MHGPLFSGVRLFRSALRRFAPSVAAILALLLLPEVGHAADDLLLSEKGTSRAEIVVDPAIMADDLKISAQTPFEERQAEQQRQRLRESVRDLSLYLEKISGGKFPIVADPSGNAVVPVLIGTRGVAVFGAAPVGDRAGQGWRVVVDSQRGVGLIGQTPLGTSYAVYELLHRLGCRWYMPSDLGEHIPPQQTIRLTECNDSGVPSTLYRGIWYGDEDFKRRIRQGGLLIHAGHALEGYVSKEQREAHPEWRAVIDEKPHAALLTWTRPEVRTAISESIIARLEKRYDTSVSLSPYDGAKWDESYDTRHDAGDFDPGLQTVSKTDRLLVLCNEIAERVTKKYPDMLFGMLAYVDYTRPPVREKVHPAIVPQIAPITYNRAHPMTFADHPDGGTLKELVEGWAGKCEMMSHYWYGYNLAEITAPNPFITKWGTDIPLLMKNNCRFWQPETLPNFETTLIGLNLGMRLAWDSSQKPEDIVSEIMRNFYGAAAEPMSAYWHHIDRAWIEGREYSGSGFGYLRIFTPEKLQRARQLMDEATAACRTPTEKARVLMASESLARFELLMQLRRDLAEGRLAELHSGAERWRTMSEELREKYKPQYAFNSHGGHFALSYFNAFFGKAFDEGSRIAAENKLLTAENPLREWSYLKDPEQVGVEQKWFRPEHDSSSWKTTDTGTETWSTLGHHHDMGVMWYRRMVAVPEIPQGRNLLLWIPSTDGAVRVYVNGRHVPWQDTKTGESVEEFTGYCQPASFDITRYVKPGEPSQITLRCDRKFLNELGTGGLLAPPMLYLSGR